MKYVNDLKEFVGKTVTGLFVAGEESHLRFAFTEGDDLVLNVEGDCCSESWFADIVDTYAFRDAKILSVEEIPMPTPTDKRTRQEYDSQYGLLFKTDKGSVNIVYRNSSNGYYGGNLALYRKGPASDPKLEWKKINIGSDWTAPGNG